MAVTEAAARAFIVGYLSDHFHMPPSYFTDDVNLRDDLLFTTEALVVLGKRINQAHSIDVYVTPKEIAACKTVGDIVALIASK